MRPDPRDASLQDRVRLRHMLDAAREAVQFVDGRARDELKSDRMLLLAVVKAIEIVGEAARCVTDSTRSHFPELEWGQIVGMRHRVIHIYFAIDPDIVWDTVVGDLPPMIQSLERHLGPDA